MYCVASSAGTSYSPWPRRAYSPHSDKYRKKAERMNPLRSEKEVLNVVAKPTELMGSVDALMKDEGSIGGFSDSGSLERPGTPDSDMSSIASAGVTTMSHRQKDRSEKTSTFGCLRNVVLRGPPYLLVVDRRCVWRMCPANNFGDTNELSAKEKIAHKLLRSAEEGLDKSEKMREGEKVYDGLSYDGRPLVGGEQFPKLLRNIVAQQSFKRETLQLGLRRKQEQLLQDHFEGLYSIGAGSESNTFPSPLPLPSPSGRSCSDRSRPGRTNSKGKDDDSSTFITLQTDIEKQSRDAFHISRQNSMNDKIPDDNSYGMEVLRLHKTLHAANAKLLSSLASSNPPTTPFTATFGYAGDLASVTNVYANSVSNARNASSGIQVPGRGSIIHSSFGGDNIGFGLDPKGDNSSRPRLGGGGSGTSALESAQAMNRLSRRLKKLNDVDEAVQQALHHRERIEKYGRIASVFKNLSTVKGKDGRKTSSESKQFIPDINIDGYDPSTGT